MKKCLIILFLLISLPIAFAKVEDVDCFQYYKFQEGMSFDNLLVEKAVYNHGDKITVSYNLKSYMESPIVQGSVRVQIFYNDPDNGETMIDEFFAAKDINLFLNDDIRQEFSWTIPAGASAGEYIVKTYFIVDGSFNLAGLSFLAYGPPGVPGAMTTFKVENPGVSRIYFDKSKTTMNGEEYTFGGFSPSYSNISSVNVKTWLVNEGKAKDIKYTIKTYDWDDLTDKPLSDYTVEKTVSFDSNEAKEITYDISSLKTGTYGLKLIAESGDEKAILKMRFSITGAKGRFIYLGLDRFPLKANEESTLFFCLSNSADYQTSFNGSGTVQILDENNKEIFKEDFGPFEVVPTPMGEKISFTLDKSYTKVTLKINLKGEDGTVMDSPSVVYDYSKFLNIPAILQINLDKNSYNPDDTLKYTISYKNNLGTGLNGDLLIYLLDSEDKIILSSTAKTSEIYSGTMQVPKTLGQYTLTVRELTRDLKESKTFTIAQTADDYTLWIVGGIVAVVLVVAVIFIFRKKS